MAVLFGLAIPDDVAHALEAVVIAAGTYVAAWLVRRLFLRSVERSGRQNVIGRLVSRLFQAIIVIVGVLAIIATLNIDVSSVVISLGAVSIAVSFALSTLLNNMVSGVLILADDSVRVGDTIKVGELQGRVTRIRVRASELETADGKRIFIPNVYLAQNPVVRLERGKKPS